LIINDLYVFSVELFFKTDIHTKFDSAKRKILYNTTGSFQYDVAILDLRLTNRDIGVTYDGADLGRLIKAKMPQTRIIIFTSIASHRKFHNIFQTINPEGFWIKDEIKTPEEIKKGILDVLNGKTFYSPLISTYLKDTATGMLRLDQVDRDLLHYLAQGIKNKDLPAYLNLSLSAVEKRKRNIIKVFEVDNLDDAELIRKAKEKGAI